MLILLSPAKTLDFQSDYPLQEMTHPFFEKRADKIVKVLKSYKPKALSELMSISSDLSYLNYERFQNWTKIGPDHLRPSVFAFKGDVYIGLDAQSLSKSALAFSQNHLRILSGLYGYLRPFDLIKPYRLEMGTNLSIDSKRNLYNYWRNDITQLVKKDLGKLKSNIIINLASNEYAKCIDFKSLDAKVISPEFKESKDGGYKIISFFAKKARGQMSRFIIENEINDPDDLITFDIDGYIFNQKMSVNNKMVFTRG
ncbi:MAG: peroxide stress protein YaaA [Bacteroidetes bacterium HGW-Bacteroidetes-1]|jgi:hypothetical protein|nr:MAG: peroxide stress protein YaaA [Bacteroidetes bacterium HGW-Bacteroidetes-1]